MSDYSKLTKKQLLEIINKLEEDKPDCEVCQENEKEISELEKQVNDLEEEIKDIKHKQFLKDRYKDFN